MEGAWRARGETVVFLDSHIEATPGWIEPLLARIHEGSGHVVVPSIDGVDADELQYKIGQGLGILHFTWGLNQEPSTVGGTNPDPMMSPVMAGGLFAAHRKHFLHLGGYDQGMQLYAGEEMEIGFRTWMCGGTLELMPCSHVGHIFRTPSHWQGQVYRVPGEAIARNRLRTAEVWMDKYVQLVRLTNMKLEDIGSLEKRKAIREKLKCKSFDWYLANIAPWLHKPKFGESSYKGSLANKKHNGCIDNLQGTRMGSDFGVYPCHGLHGSQAIVLDDDGQLLHGESQFVICLDAFEDDSSWSFRQMRCERSSRWRWEANLGKFRHLKYGKCLVVRDKQVSTKSPFSLSLASCEEDDPEQLWEWRE